MANVLDRAFRVATHAPSIETSYLNPRPNGSSAGRLQCAFQPRMGAFRRAAFLFFFAAVPGRECAGVTLEESAERSTEKTVRQLGDPASGLGCGAIGRRYRLALLGTVDRFVKLPDRSVRCRQRHQAAPIRPPGQLAGARLPRIDDANPPDPCRSDQHQFPRPVRRSAPGATPARARRFGERRGRLDTAELSHDSCASEAYVSPIGSALARGIDRPVPGAARWELGRARRPPFENAGVILPSPLLLTLRCAYPPLLSSVHAGGG